MPDAEIRRQKAAYSARHDSGGKRGDAHYDDDGGPCGLRFPSGQSGANGAGRGGNATLQTANLEKTRAE